MKKIMIVLLSSFIFCSAIACGTYEGTADEKAAAKLVYSIHEQMKDPDSYVLHGDIVVLYGEESKHVFTYIDCSGNNDFGVEIRNTIGFFDDECVGVIGGETIDSSSVSALDISYLTCTEGYEAYLNGTLSTWENYANNYKIMM